MADDVAAEAFERAFAALDRFDDRRPFSPWLHRIVANRALDLLRAERRPTRGDAEEAVDLELDRRAGDQALLAAVAELSLERRVSVPQLTAQPSLIHTLQAGLSGQGAYLLPDTLASIGRTTPPWLEHARTTLPAEARPQTKSEPPVEGDRTTP